MGFKAGTPFENSNHKAHCFELETAMWEYMEESLSSEEFVKKYWSTMTLAIKAKPEEGQAAREQLFARENDVSCKVLSNKCTVEADSQSDGCFGCKQMVEATVVGYAAVLYVKNLCR